MRISDWSSDVCSSDLHKSRLDLVQIARQTSTVLSRQPPSKVPARQPKDKQRLSSVHLLGNCGFKAQQEEAAKRHGCHTGERAGSGIGEARIEQIRTEERGVREECARKCRTGGGRVK